MTRPRISICGDSYSAVNAPTTCYATVTESYSWIHDIQKDYSVECLAESGRSNFDILKQVKRARGDIIISNVTSLNRVAFAVSKRSVEISKADLQLHNLKISRLISRLSDVCWTPFVGYEEVPEILYLPFERENELYNDHLKDRLTKHHLTQRGNELLRDEMLKQLERILHDYNSRTVS
jgi:uncharacterized protein involved in tolerance to divalent cations